MCSKAFLPWWQLVSDTRSIVYCSFFFFLIFFQCPTPFIFPFQTGEKSPCYNGWVRGAHSSNSCAQPILPPFFLFEPHHECALSVSDWLQERQAGSRLIHVSMARTRQNNMAEQGEGMALFLCGSLWNSFVESHCSFWQLSFGWKPF